MKHLPLVMCASMVFSLLLAGAQDKPADAPAAKPAPPTIDPIVRGNYFKANAQMRYFQQRAEGSKAEVDAYTQAMRAGCTKPGYHFAFDPVSDEPGCVVDPPKAPETKPAEPEKK